MIPESVLAEVKRYAKLAFKANGFIVERSYDDEYAFRARLANSYIMNASKPVYLLVHERTPRHYKLLCDVANYLPRGVYLCDVTVFEDGSFKTSIYIDPKRAFAR